jgi:hypothetical protein
MRPSRIQDPFIITNDLFVRDDLASHILKTDDIENKHETMENTGPIHITNDLFVRDVIAVTKL